MMSKIQPGKLNGSIAKDIVTESVEQIGSEVSYSQGNINYRFLNIATRNQYDPTNRGLLIDSEDLGNIQYVWSSENDWNWGVVDSGTHMKVIEVKSDDPQLDKKSVEEWLNRYMDKIRTAVKNRNPTDTSEVEIVGMQELEITCSSFSDCRIKFMIE